MKQILQNIQNQPDTVKHVLMWVGIFLIMTTIFSFWLLNFSSQLSQTVEDESTSKIKEGLPSVFNSLKSQVNFLFETLKNLNK